MTTNLNPICFILPYLKPYIDNDCMIKNYHGINVDI